MDEAQNNNEHIDFKEKIKPFLPVLLLSFVWLAVVSTVSFNKYESYSEIVRKLVITRFAVIACDVSDEVENGLDKGTILNGLKSAVYILSKQDLLNGEIKSINIFEKTGKTILFSTDKKLAGTKIPETWEQNWYEEKIGDRKVWIYEKEQDRYIGTPVINALGEEVGGTAVHYTFNSYNEAVSRIKKAVMTVFIMFVLSGLIFIGISCFIYNKLKAVDDEGVTETAITEKIKIRIINKSVFGTFAFVLLIVLPCLFLEYKFYFKPLQAHLGPSIEQKSSALVKSVVGTINRAVGYGMPFGYLGGMDVYLENIRKKHPETIYILVTDTEGQVLYETGSTKEAYKTTPKGAILKNGCHNSAEPVVLKYEITGWVQLGVCEHKLEM